MHINCCNANGPRAFMMLPRFAVMKGSNEIYLNIYSKSRFNIPLNHGVSADIIQETDNPVSDEIVIMINPSKAESFTVALRIPSWSKLTNVTVNNVAVPNVSPGDYCRINRLWQSGDMIKLKLDLRGHLLIRNGCQAIIRGPVVLARDARFNDGFIYESAVVRDNDGFVDLKKSVYRPENVWMSFTAPLVLGTDLEGEFLNPEQVNFCDFASAGNTWGEDSRCRVWIPKTLNIMNQEYKGY